MADYLGKVKTNEFEINNIEEIKKLCQSLSSEGKIVLTIYFRDEKNYASIDSTGELDYASNRKEENLSEIKGGSKCRTFEIYEIVQKDISEADADSDEEKGSMTEFYQKLQTLLPDGAAAAFMEVGSENMKFLIAFMDIITNKEIRDINFIDVANEVGKEMVGSDDEDYSLGLN